MSETESERLSLAERHVLQAIRNLRYGAIQVVVHDAKVVQVDKTEKTRFDPSQQFI